VNTHYAVVDIETDGPAAGYSSMLSLGAVMVTDDSEVDSFYRKIAPIPGMKPSQVTMDWWKTQPEAWQEVIRDARPAAEAMRDFAAWIGKYSSPGAPVFVSHPVAFDYSFVSWYLWKFNGHNPFTTPAGSPLTLDLTSYASGKLKRELDESTRSSLAAEFMQEAPPHTHRAIDDARGYGILLRNLLRA
jgi:DNA polymerase III alpha subunit (gram-positive type)